MSRSVGMSSTQKLKEKKSTKPLLWQSGVQTADSLYNAHVYSIVQLGPKEEREESSSHAGAFFSVS